MNRDQSCRHTPVQVALAVRNGNDDTNEPVSMILTEHTRVTGSEGKIALVADTWRYRKVAFSRIESK